MNGKEMYMNEEAEKKELRRRIIQKLDDILSDAKQLDDRNWLVKELRDADGEIMGYDIMDSEHTTIAYSLPYNITRYFGVVCPSEMKNLIMDIMQYLWFVEGDR